MPDKFKDEQSFAQSYTELERKLTELAETNKQLEGMYVEAVEAFQAPQQQAQQQDASNYWRNLYDEDPFQATALLVQQSNAQLLQQLAQQTQQANEPSQVAQGEIVAQLAINHLSNVHNDFSAYEDRIKETIEQNPYLLPESAYQSPTNMANALEVAYKMVKAEDVLSGNVQTVDQTNAKLAAQSLSGAGNRTPTPDQQAEEWKRIQAAGEQPYWARRSQ